ncbi:4-hydroxy-tetrahydrodipicolinate reductase [Clostridioides difficile]|nr:4-hydroxy-tetrahydrodipicolinate reductase [Clostridioides difficile]
MLKVIISGYNGTMGRVLAECVKKDNELELVCGVARSADEKGHHSDTKLYKTMTDVAEKTDVIIDFSHHETLEPILSYALKNNTPVVLATTGYDENDLNKIEEASKNIPILLSSNTSLGVNILIKLVKDASKMLEGFDIEIIEKHHNRKEDAPSGTATMIANAIREVLPESENTHGRDCKRKSNEIGIHSIRGGNIISDHDVVFAGDNEVLTLSHHSQSDEVFANGSIVAAKFLIGKQSGLYKMSDILG